MKLGYSTLAVQVVADLNWTSKLFENFARGNFLASEGVGLGGELSFCGWTVGPMLVGPYLRGLGTG
jgi:hypothetical protein